MVGDRLNLFMSLFTLELVSYARLSAVKMLVMMTSLWKSARRMLVRRILRFFMMILIMFVCVVGWRSVVGAGCTCWCRVYMLV